MCLGVPGQIVTITGNVALMDSWGRRHQASLSDMKEHVCPGDFIIEHLGVAVRKIPAESVTETMAMYETVLPEAGDPFSEQIVCEVEGDLVLALA